MKEFDVQNHSKNLEKIIQSLNVHNMNSFSQKTNKKIK